MPFRWVPTEHALGRGSFLPANVASLEPLVLTSPAGSLDGAEVHTDSLFSMVTVQADMDCPDVPGILCSLFFYQQDVGNRADEIDIEIVPGQRTVGFTIWRDGRQVFHSTRPWAPGAPVSVGIRREASRVRFQLAGFADIVWEREVPLEPMPLYASIWWPTWVEGDPIDDTARYRLTGLQLSR